MKELGGLLKRAREIIYMNVKRFGDYRIVVPHYKAYPMPYCWDTAFHVLALVHIDSQLAKENIEGLLSFMREDGMIPNAPIERENQDLRSQPPIILYAAKYYLENTNDAESLKKWYPLLKKHYEWWRKNGSPAGSIRGLISPFSGARGYSPRAAYWAVCSTGMDNHPVYDFTGGRVTKVGEYYYLEVEDLLLTGSLSAGAKALCEIADVLGYGKDKEYFQKEFDELSLLINEYMWFEDEGFCYPITWKGERMEIKTIQAFTMLYASVLDHSRASKLISHLTSPKEFWGEYGIPTIAFDDKLYMTKQPQWMYSRDPYYWRGPIWPPTTVLIALGLLNYGYRDLVEKIADKWLKLIGKSGVFAEYYYENGNPGSTRRFNFGWTAAATILLALKSGFAAEEEIKSKK